MKARLVADIIKTAITFTIWAIVAPLITLIGIPCALLPVRYRFSNRLYYIGSYIGSILMVKATFIKFDIKGKKNLLEYLAKPSIIACNHSSAIDIPLVQMLIGPRPHLWFSKASYAKIPIFGFVLRRMHILVKRESTASSTNSITQALDRTAGRQNHVLIFPEGMRHNDGTIHRFFSGFAVMAQELDRPVIPVVVYGLNTVFSKDSKVIHSSANKVALSIGKPMCYTGAETRQEFAKRVHTWFVNELEELSRNK